MPTKIPPAVRLRPLWRRRLGANLRTARLAAGKSQGQLALDMGVIRQTIHRTERGSQQPDVNTLLLWCLACRVRLADVLEEVP